MSTAASPSTALGAPRAANRPRSDRLWPALSRPVQRPLPPRGFDLAGEWIGGAAARARSARRMRRRAESIVARAQRLASAAEELLDREIDDARRAAVLARDQDATVDAAYAVAYEVVRRTIGLSLHVEQVMGALAMADGGCAEMATGEGKTVTAILPAALEGWAGGSRGGVHVLTVNDYLARRDAEWTGAAYKRLGLRVGTLQDSTPSAERRDIYLCDIVYTADKQVIFDHLRDRLIAPLRPSLTGHLLDQVLAPDKNGGRDRRSSTWGDTVVQRGLYAAIVDEADSILIDEAVTPAIIAATDASGTPWGGEEHYRTAAAIARELQAGTDYTVNTRLREIALTSAGRARLGDLAQRGGLTPFWSGPRRREELLIQALSAKELYRRGDDYILRDGKEGQEVVIVDRSTGRVLEGRKWQLGLHQAVEAKEAVPITGVHTTSARSSYQRFFQRFARLSGMSGTAWEVRHELWRDYRLPVVRIPTHKPCQRRRMHDIVAPTQDRKFERVADRVVRLHERGQPVLIGTRSVEASERLGAMLAERGVRCKILNATREAEEAAIVAQAGRIGAITVATNMAGRGTDIRLDPEAREKGGLFVIATERHDEHRVDRQLFGRAGRQGDPGMAQAIVSLDDPVITVHGLGPLVWLAKAAKGPLRRPVARLLWRQAQHTASRRAAVQRREVARQDAWLEMAMHNESR